MPAGLINAWAHVNEMIVKAEKHMKTRLAPAAPVVAQRELSILYPWITKLSLRYQGVLLAAIRGCDGRPKNDISKSLNRAIRNICLVPFDPRELAYEGFMSYDMAKWREDMTLFEAAKDEYPVHYVMHMVNAISVVAYEHPDPSISGEFMWAYQLLAKGFHFHIESRDELKGRMERDRIVDRKSKEHQATKAAVGEALAASQRTEGEGQHGEKG